MSQAEVINFLKSAEGHPGGGPVDVVETHGAIIFLAGETALKIKRDVTYDYMDLSTPVLREKMLRRELELNKPVAPKIYQDVVAVTRGKDGALTLNGSGEPVEWVLRMWRFPADAELSVIADRHGIDDAMARNLGKAVYAYHCQSPVRHDRGAKLITDILDELGREFAGMHAALGPDRIEAFARPSRSALDRLAAHLDSRTAEGHVRRCHGDLHLGNIVVLDGAPVPFDALEFDEVLGTCDVLYDLAFLLMDLDHRDLRRAANIVLTSYLVAAGGAEDPGLSTLPLFLAVRAAIRAMVAVQTASATHEGSDGAAALFLQSAVAYLAPPSPSLVLIGGLSGTGKTTVARAVAPFVGPAPGAVHLRTDVERKAALGLDEKDRAPDRAYSPSDRAAIYTRLIDRAEKILSAGHSVLMDATFLDPDVRAKATEVAARTGVKVWPIWLDAPIDILFRRVNRRSGDASDADADVVRMQYASLGDVSGWIKVSADGSPEDTEARVRDILGLAGMD